MLSTAAERERNAATSQTASSTGQCDRGSQRQRVMERRYRNYGEAIVLALQPKGDRSGGLWRFKE